MNDAETSGPKRDWYLGLGSNVGDRELMLRKALIRLNAIPGIAILRTSRVYETAPWGESDQRPFLNMVALARSLLTPLQLLSEVKRIERDLGRRARRRWGPREIDIDLLFCEGFQINTPELTVPHPLILQRQFVIVPLADVNAELVLPGGQPVSSYMRDDASVRVWSEPIEVRSLQSEPDVAD